MDKQKTQVASVRKALDVLDILAFEDIDHDGMRLSDLARFITKNLL